MTTAIAATIMTGAKSSRATLPKVTSIKRLISCARGVQARKRERHDEHLTAVGLQRELVRM